ncbi:Arrestin or S-antigen, domain-containing protein [Cladophialophora immunda]|nr:Arrestin or S-antigen, domain-containing protein [Cladophialophora immunda]
MSLSIQLPTKIGPYHPGSHLSGTIHLTSVESVPIGSLVVTFTGVSRVTLTQNYGDLNVSSTDYHSREVLFRRENVLYTGGKWTHRAGVYSWPFEFRVPEYTDDRVAWRCPAVQRTIQGAHRHALPPTMLYTCRGFACLVDYILEAALKPPSSSPTATMGKRITTKHAISVLPRTVTGTIASQNPNSRVDGQFYVHRHQSFQIPRRKIAISQENPMARILKFSKFQREDPNEAATASSLSISVRLPRRIEVREDYSRMSILFRGRSASNTGMRATTSAHPPSTATALTIKTLKIAVIQHTHVQAGRHPSTSTRKTYSRKTTCSLPLPVYPCETLPLSANGAGAVEIAAQTEVDLAELTQLRIPRESLVPDFATYNAAVEHTLELEIGFECEGRNLKFACQDVAIAVIPASGTQEYSPVQAEGSRIEMPGESESSRAGMDGIIAQTSNQEARNNESEARTRGRGNASWIVPPPELSSTGVHSSSERDAFFSQPPPRYTPRS